MWEDKRKIYRECDIDIVVPSAWLKSIVEKSMLRDKRLRVIYNGIDENVFCPRGKRAVREKLGIAQEAVVLGFVADKGLLDSRKGGAFVIEAYEYLSAKYPNLWFMCIGAKVQNAPTERFLQIPHVSDERSLSCIYSAADVFMLPTLADNCPLIVLELMGCGVPVVSFDTGGVPELIEHGVTGLLAKRKDANNLVIRTEQLINSASMREMLGRASRERLLEKFTLSQMAEQYLALYEQLVEEHRAGAGRGTKRRITKSPDTSARPIYAPVARECSGSKAEPEEYLVSAIVSTYNSEEFIRGCLEDLEAQTIADKLEIIVVNSGSEQNEETVVREFQGRYDNIRYIKTEQREGLYAAWNRAVRTAKGRFLTSANTDDRHRRDALETLAKTLLDNPDIALVYGDQIVTDTANGTFQNHHVLEQARRPGYSHERLLFGCCVGSQPVWRRSLHDEFGYFDESLDCAADWDFWLRVSKKYAFKHVPEFLGLYYRNEEGIEHGREIHSLYERYLVGKRYGNPYISVFQTYEAKGNPFVSVIMPAYNAERYIASAIESVLIQNYRNFELVLVDDGSADGTRGVIESFEDEHIRCIRQNRAGASAARNRAIREAKGQFIVPLDTDDMIAVDFVARHLQAFEQDPQVDMVYCDDLLIDENDKPLRTICRTAYEDSSKLVQDLFRSGFPVVPFRTCIRRAVFDEIGWYDEGLRVAEDYDMVRRFVKAGLGMGHLAAPLYWRRMTQASLSRGASAEKARDHFRVLRRFTETFGREELFPEVDWQRVAAEQHDLLAKCRFALVYLSIGNEYTKTERFDYASAAFDLAREELSECLVIEPDNPKIVSLLEKCESLHSRYSQPEQQLSCIA
jgi:glycosyltransferase involved in cell wall biosynthesis